LDRLYKRAIEDISIGKILEFDREIFIDDENHHWGPSPFHYQETYYHTALEMLTHVARTI
jgi:hypothetical protein